MPVALAPVTAPQRLRSNTDIRAVLRARRSRAGRLVVLHARGRDDDAPARVAVVASRKVGGAVQRNRAKRVLREAVRTLPLAGGVDLVLIARAGTASVRMQEVATDLRRLARDLAVIEEDA